MFRINHQTIRPKAVIVSTRSRGAASVALLIVIGAAFVVASIAIIILFLRAAPGPVTFTLYNGSITTPMPFPSGVDSNVSVTYMVTTNTVTVPYGAGPGFPPISKTKPVAVEGAVVVFNLANGDATFSDGSISKSVTTGANGLANVTITPAVDGDDTLTFIMKITTGSFLWKKTHTVPDTASFQFEVDKQ